jgi:uncharacterized membrane protein
VKAPINQSVSPANRNIRAICAMEQDALDHRSISARFGDFIATHAGKMWFIGLHVIWFSGWIIMNRASAGGHAFDPFPYSLLTTIVSLESIFLSLFILMSQNRSGREADRRNHLDLQINLLAEDENTKILLMLKALCKHHNLPIGSDPEISEMALRTEVGDLVKDLNRNLPKID